MSIGDKHQRGAAVGEIEKDITRVFCTTEAQALSIESGLSTKQSFEDDEKSLSTSTEDTKDADAPFLPSEIDDDDSASIFNEPTDNDEEGEEAEASEIKINIQTSSTSVRPLSPDSSISISTQDPIDIKIAIKKLLVRRLRKMILQTVWSSVY